MGTPQAITPLVAAIAHFEDGRLDEAERLCLAELRVTSGQGRAALLNLLGLIVFHRGGTGEDALLEQPNAAADHAAALVGDAVRVAPHVPDYHLNLGNIHGCCGRTAEAMDCFHAALRLEPGCHEAYNGMGVTLARAGDLAGSLAALREAVRLRPDYPEAHNHLGAVLQATGRIVEATASLREASKLRPQYAEARFNLGMALLLQGTSPRGSKSTSGGGPGSRSPADRASLSRRSRCGTVPTPPGRLSSSIAKRVPATCCSSSATRGF